MAAIVDTSASKGSQTASTTLETDSFSIGGANRVLYVLAGSGANTPSNLAANGVKWGGSGGTALTQIGTTTTFGTNCKASLFRLIAPTAQSSTVHATWASNDDERWLICVAVEGADQTTPNGTVAIGSSNSDTTLTINVASVSGDLVLDFASILNGGGNSRTMTVGSGQTQIQNLAPPGISAYETAAASKETASSTTTAMSWSISGGINGWASFGLAVNAATGGGSANILRQMMAHHGG